MFVRILTHFYAAIQKNANLINIPISTTEKYVDCSICQAKPCIEYSRSQHVDKSDEMAFSTRWGWQRAFSFLEATILLVSTKSTTLGPLPIFEHAQSTPSVVFSQSDLPDLKNESIDRGLSMLGEARGLDSWCWPKGSWPLGTRMGREISPEFPCACFAVRIYFR